jgi:hypothetical protein
MKPNQCFLFLSFVLVCNKVRMKPNQCFVFLSFVLVCNKVRMKPNQLLFVTHHKMFAQKFDIAIDFGHSRFL